MIREKPGRIMRAMKSSLEEVAEILPGFSTNGAVVHDAHGTHQVISARHLKEGIPYRFEPPDALCIRPRHDVSRYLVKLGDVLFISRGTRNIAVEIESVPPLSIATATFYQLRVDRTKILPAFLAWSINQPPFRGRLDEIRTGAGTPLIPRAALAQIKLSVPDLPTQEAIVAYARLESRERALLSALAEQTARKHRAIGTLLLQGLSRSNTKE